MATTTAQNLDHFFSSSAARLDRWRELNAKAQAWAAEARSGKRGGGRAATEAALAEVRALEDFFAFPGVRLMKSLAERISSDDALGVGRLARRISGALLSGSYRYDSGEWESSDEDSGNVPDRLPFDTSGGTHRPYFETLIVSPAAGRQLCEDRAGNPPPTPRRRPDDLRAGAGGQLRRRDRGHDHERQDRSRGHL